jgi:ParB-like chromosome segregation protein Spo0J
MNTATKELKINEEFKNLIPPLTKEEYKGLEKSLLEEGCRDALVTWNGTIVDGHNRYELCQKHGIDFDVVEKEFENENAAKTWIIQNQLARRNLPKYVYGELVLQLEPLLAKEAKQNQIQHKVINSSLSANSPKVTNKLTGIDRRKELAKAAGIGENTISRIKNISEKAPEEIKQW